MAESSTAGPAAPTLGSSYLLFKKEVKLWTATTSIAAERQAGTILFKLPAKAKETAIELPVETLQNGKKITVGGVEQTVSGVNCLLEVLDEIYLESMSKETFKCYDEFRKLNRKGNQQVNDFVLEFEKCLKRLKDHGINLPEPVLAYELLRACNVDDTKYSVAVTLVGELTYKNMKATIKNITQKKIEKESSLSEGSGAHLRVVKEEESAYYTQKDCDESLDDNWRYDRYDEYPDQHDDVYYNSYSRGRGKFNRYPSRGSSGYYSGRGMTRTPYHNRGMSSGTSYPSRINKKTNPKDSNGNVTACNACKSIFHYARECPELKNTKSNKSYLGKSEEITLLQNLRSDTTEDLPSTMEKFTRNNFGLGVLDSGCSTTVCGQDWLDVYIDSLDETEKQKVRYEDSNMQFNFGDNAPTRSTTRCIFPATVCDEGVNIKAQIVQDQIPLLIGKTTMKNAKMVLDFSNDTVSAFGVKQSLVFPESGHPSIPLSKRTIHQDVCLCNVDSCVFLGAAEGLQDEDKAAGKLHKQFAHPPAESLKSLLRSAGKLTKKLSEAIDAVSSSCMICRRFKQQSHRPVVCMPSAKDFNDTVAMDIKEYDKGKNIYFQHMIDHKTRFSTAKVVRTKNKETVVQSVFTHWINVFGPPKQFMTDNGGEYVNSSFVDLCEKFNVHIKTTGAEAPWSNGLVERHHSLLSRNVQKIVEETGCSIDIALAWACHAKNTLSNINGYSPYQLLFGKNPVIKSIDDPYTSPTIIEDETPSETVAKNITAIYAARKHQMECEADEKIRRAMRSNIREVYSESLETRDLVYYKRDNNKRWRGPGTVIGSEGKIVFVRHGGYVVRCHRSRVVKVNDLYSSAKSENDPQHEIHSTEDDAFFDARTMMNTDIELTRDPSIQPVVSDMIEFGPEPEETSEEVVIDESIENNSTPRKEQKLCDTKSKLEKKKLTVVMKDSDPFMNEKNAEVEKWKQNSVYEETPINSIDENAEPISTRWVTTDTGSKRKARLVARGFEEEPLNSTETVSPTCRKESLRLLFSLTASFEWNLKSLDISSAFLQGKPIQRLVYLLPPKEFAKPGIVWKLNKCVYGLSDAAKMWYINVREQIEKAGLKKCLYDDALFFSRADTHVNGLMTVHVDDFIYAGTQEFQSSVGNDILDCFQIKSQEMTSFLYLGLDVIQDPDSFEITVGQGKYIQDLKTIQLSNIRKSQKTHALNSSEYAQFRSGVGQINWLACQTRPDISFASCQLSNNVKDPNIADVLQYNKLVKKLQQEDDIPLSFKAIPSINEGVRLLTYSDAAYGNLTNSGSQCGYLVFIADITDNIKNLITWKSVKLDRVCTSTLAAESLALYKAVDHTLFIQKTIQQMLGESTKVMIECYVDNKGLLELINKTKDPTEKRLICTMASLREMVERAEIKVSYIPSKEMPADVLTKRGAKGDVLRSYIDTD